MITKPKNGSGKTCQILKKDKKKGRVITNSLKQGSPSRINPG
jgi:hypothetical protein